MPHTTATHISVCQLGKLHKVLEELDVMVALVAINLIILQHIKERKEQYKYLLAYQQQQIPTKF